MTSIPSLQSHLFLSEEPEKCHIWCDCPQAETAAHSRLCSQGLGVLCLPVHFVWPWEPFSGDWCCPLRMSVVNWRQEDELRWAGKPRAARKWALSFGVGPPSRLEGALYAVKKRKKERKKENEKLMREEESQGGRKSRRGKAEKEFGEEGREEKREMWRKVAVLAHEELTMHPAQGFTYIIFFNVYNSL